ncbi:PEP-utilizing enzyme [Rhodococcus sp. JVH1]|nr:PEP-utilizing enzyme [Rhodococcus sp. JVH1]
MTDPVRGNSEPARYWSTTNVAEATPDILSPLCWSVWGDGLERAWLTSMYEFGVLAKSELAMAEDMNRRSTASIYGRQAANVDLLRAVLARLPGVKPDEVERDLLGSVRPDTRQEPGTPARAPIVLVKFPIAMLRLDGRMQRMYDEQRTWWRREVYDVSRKGSAPTGSPLERLRSAADRFAVAMTLHAMVRFLLPAAEGAVHSAAQSAGASELAAPALQGWGNVAETEMAERLWRVGRGEVTVEDFLAEYAFHGPNEGNVYTRSWREQPERVEGLVASYRGRSDVARPLDREAATMAAREEAERQLLRALPRRKRPVVSFMLRRSAGLIRKLEMGKAAYLMALDGARAAARVVGAELVEAGRLDEIDDAFFLTIPELESLFADSTVDVRPLIAYRRGERERYADMILPVSFTGMPTVTAAPNGDLRRTEIAGKAWGGCRVEGRARLVLNAADDIELCQGDILVCRFTDPSWAPLMSLAEALVIDIGSQSSHGAVVARELGIPYVIGTDDGTRIIKEGDRIVVDGTTGTVVILDAGDVPKVDLAVSKQMRSAEG